MALTLLLLLLLVGSVAGLTAVLMRQSAQGVETTVAEAQRHASRTSTAAIVVGLVAAVVAGCAATLPLFAGRRRPDTPAWQQ
jgi:hypothetical protein